MAAHFFYSRNTLVRISKSKVQISITTKSHLSGESGTLLIFKVKGQGHRVKFLGEGIRHALPLFSLDLVSMIYKQDF
jgi:hypothetical protein